MPDSRIRQILLALVDNLEAGTGVPVLFEADLPEAIPEEGLINLHEGDPGEPEVTVSPMVWHYEHEAVIEVLAQGPDRETVLDSIKQSIGAALAGDRTLGGLCDWVEPGAPVVITEPVLGGDSVRMATIPVTICYATTDPLG